MAHMGRESGVGNRESGAVRPKGDLLAHWKAHRGSRNPPLTPVRSGRAGNGENYPGNYCVSGLDISPDRRSSWYESLLHNFSWLAR
ncbi:MAG: hypothetical protein F6K49_32940 [Moorea sp. SIO3I6]|nr:hypothetical protein [Moorena sp. SIO3I6]